MSSGHVRGTNSSIEISSSLLILVYIKLTKTNQYIREHDYPVIKNFNI